MRVTTTLILLALGWCLIGTSITTTSQSGEVKIRFELDGQEINPPQFKILIQADGQTLEPRIANNKFIVPREINAHQKVDVRFVSGKYDLLFSSLIKSHFDSEWLIGVDNPPFELQDADTPSETGKDVALIYFIEFHPEKTEGTRWVTKVYK